MAQGRDTGVSIRAIMNEQAARKAKEYIDVQQFRSRKRREVGFLVARDSSRRRAVQCPLFGELKFAAAR